MNAVAVDCHSIYLLCIIIVYSMIKGAFLFQFHRIIFIGWNLVDYFVAWKKSWKKAIICWNMMQISLWNKHKRQWIFNNFFVVKNGKDLISNKFINIMLFCALTAMPLCNDIGHLINFIGQKTKKEECKRYCEMHF